RPAAPRDVHSRPAPLRQPGRAAGDAGLVNLWAGQTYELGRQLPAGQLVRALGEEARTALQQAQERLGPPRRRGRGGALGRRAPLSDASRPRHSPGLAPDYSVGNPVTPTPELSHGGTASNLPATRPHNAARSTASPICHSCAEQR